MERGVHRSIVTTGLLLLAGWLEPTCTDAAILYQLEGEGCFVYNPNEFGGNGEGGCHPITGSIRMPDSYVPGSEFVVRGRDVPAEETPYFYLYMYTWTPINPVVREYMTTHGSITLPVSSGPASWLWCSSEGCTGLNSDASSDGGFRWAIAESWAIRGTQRYTLVPTYVPEPGTLAMLGLGLAGLGFVRRRCPTGAGLAGRRLARQGARRPVSSDGPVRVGSERRVR